MRIKLVKSEYGNYPPIEVVGSTEGIAVIIFIAYLNAFHLSQGTPHTNFDADGNYNETVLFGQDTLKALMEVAAIYGLTIEVS